MSNQVIDKLNDLLEKSIDASKGYKQAKDNAEGNNLKQFLNAYSAQRVGFETELKDLINQLGGKVKDSGSATAALHRSWINIKSTVSGSTDEAIMEECLRGENAALEEYRDAIEIADVDATAQGLLEKHIKGINEAISQLKGMEEVVSH